MSERHCGLLYVNMIVPRLDAGFWVLGMGTFASLWPAGLGTVPWLQKAFQEGIPDKCTHGFLLRLLVLNHLVGLCLCTELGPDFENILIFVHL